VSLFNDAPPEEAHRSRPPARSNQQGQRAGEERPSRPPDTLRADSKLKRKAESELKGRLKPREGSQGTGRQGQGHEPDGAGAPPLDEMLADAERQRLFRIIEDLVLWANTTNETVLQAARDEIWASSLAWTRCWPRRACRAWLRRSA
jgi:hypothetical protein